MNDQLQFPFSAIVEQYALKTALLLHAIDPGLGGVLLRGKKGTAKSTAVRGWVTLLPDIDTIKGSFYHQHPDEKAMAWEAVNDNHPSEPGHIETIATPFVELPLNATEDRLAGSIDLEATLKNKKLSFRPGLLAAANRGVLYVDEVNLLEDYLVDLLLDAAASGINIVEREGFSLKHPARFSLIGSMNPEEGELRPQFLDRFSLCVQIDDVNDPNDRKEIISRHLRFDDDPVSFLARWNEEEAFWADQIVLARRRLRDIRIPEAILQSAAHIATSLGAQGHRADISMIRAARALAALLEERAVNKRHLAETAAYALLHRVEGSAYDFDANAEKIASTLPQLLDGAETRNLETNKPEAEEPATEAMQIPGAAASGSILLDFIKKKSDTQPVKADDQFDISALNPLVPRTLLSEHGKKSSSATAKRGRYLRAAKPGHLQGVEGSAIAFDASLKAFAVRLATETASEDILQPQDLRIKIRRQPSRTLYLFIVDASESMQQENRMRAAKGAVLKLLASAYQQKHRLAMVAFSRNCADVVLPPTRSFSFARKQLQHLRGQGATPMANGFLKTLALLHSERLKHSLLHPVIILVSDGEANVSSRKGIPVYQELRRIARRFNRAAVESVVIDCQLEFQPHTKLLDIAKQMGARYYAIPKLQPDRLLNTILTP